MIVILILIGASLIVALGFLAAFLWSVQSGQFEDRDTPAYRILFDDKPVKKNKNDKNERSRERENVQ